MILLGAGLVRLVFSTSLSGNDDMSAATCALRLLDEGPHNPGGHYCARFGLTLPLAAVFALAGTGAAQISVVPALANLGGILLAWRLGTLLLGPATGLSAAALLALFPMHIEFAGMAFPDVLQGTLLSGAVLCALLASRHDGARGWALAAAAGLLWAWAHLVKLDAFVLGGVLLVAALMRLVKWQHVLATGLVALAVVGVELVAYAVLAGDPLQRVHWESAGANEITGAGRDYRSLLTYPKAMFLVPYTAGLHYYLLLLGVAAALWTRSRPALFLVAWCVIWQAWLTIGSDPFSGFRLKPQLGRYLLSWSIPMSVLAGWACVLLWRRTRVLGVGVAAGVVACAAVFAPFNQLSYEAPMATRVALEAARRESWFPLYPDVQSLGMVRFLLRGRPEAAMVHPVQRHDFLRGETTFGTIPGPRAYLLVNESYARRLESRSLVRPIRPDGFGLLPTPVLRVGNPMPPVSYASLRLLVAAAQVLPGVMRAQIEGTAAEVLRTDDASVWKLDAPASPRTD